jgi:hypothetical protein
VWFFQDFLFPGRLRRGQILLGQHDISYRLFFSHARMVCDLLREMVGESWVDLIDFASAERVNASFVSEKRKNRESDIIWQFRRRHRRSSPDWESLPPRSRRA